MARFLDIAIPAFVAVATLLILIATFAHPITH